MTRPSRFKVAVLVASFNGRQWIAEQFDSILNQLDVDVQVFVSDDCSIDDTWAWLSQMSLSYSNISLLSRNDRFGSAGSNFYRLITEVDTRGFDFVAFSDQDDLWDIDKLSRHIKLLQVHNADSISSNVIAFWPDGAQQLIVKSQPQRKFDYLFESAGPGCTFLMTPRLVAKVRDVLRDVPAAKAVSLHDWLTYAVARASGLKWIIDSRPSILYRQHAHNVVGANTSLQAKWIRIKKMREGWYRQQVAAVSQVAYAINHKPEIGTLLSILPSTSWGSRLRLLRYAWHGRRSVFDRWALMVSILLGFF
ncbi:glycosyltransferase [Methylobacillus sp. Pita2]|uniref:glycosyltransferase n=1 Tax=Methylobacillus sp. Pita2 TaxID=3383245 RepID=UPI0038B4C621